MNVGRLVFTAASTPWKMTILKVTYQDTVIKYQYRGHIKQDNILSALIVLSMCLLPGAWRNELAHKSGLNGALLIYTA